MKMIKPNFRNIFLALKVTFIKHRTITRRKFIYRVLEKAKLI
jgi:hypothetical protein